MQYPVRLSRRSLLALAAAAATPLAAQQAAPAFRPTRPVRILSPQQAGGSTDAILRPLAQKLSDLWGQPVVLDNRPGGGSIIATQAVVQAPPDGHTLGLAINSLTINPSLRNDLPYDTLADLTPVTQIGSATVALVAHPSLGVQTLGEFVQLAKARPGAIAWASLGIGTGGHITGELLRKRAGIDIVHVPFSGSSGAYRELLPGRVQAAFVVLESAMPHVRAGNLRLLAVTDPRRNRQFPQVPTLEESYPGVAYEGIFGLVAPPGLPPEIVRAIHADIARVLAEPSVRQHRSSRPWT
ncbi:tripartite tricarboxylate transporter substrate binding protein [Ramlibacter terrae]|uniref:Tripartite tricarboxylate transporter substrate binding protein n=1 Tax=Ramlibacter terrae TaxID=2732511 RepID=A0ABX6P4E6_9BURK|nr:tripartite tricarboxylate transporter substrate binding protein [Ramlibacter terrae]